MTMKLYTGVVESRLDPLMLGRCQVRVVGIHTANKTQLPTEELPWAMPMQRINSAGVSGVGESPVGVVEGTWVVVAFQDEDTQFPIILGTLGGIPQAEGPIEEDIGTLTVGSGSFNTVYDQNGNISQEGVPSSSAIQQDPKAVDQVVDETQTSALGKPANQYNTISNDCLNHLKASEGLAKKIGNNQVQAYPDPATGGEPWTIGYGTTFINGRKVAPGDIITISEAERIFLEQVKKDYLPAVTSRVRAVVTQGMIDAMVSFVYNVGSGTFSKSSILRNVNSGKYEEAASAFLLYNKAAGKVLPGLVRRREEERDMFLRDGIPGKGKSVTPPAAAAAVSRPPVGSPQQNGSNAPSTGTASDGASGLYGFRDPNEKYPRYINEPDTNRLARHEGIKDTVVYSKEAAILKDVATAREVKWTQTPIPYNAEYPFNKVLETESGHILEFDDTPEAERVHLYHKAGTFVEIDHNGTKSTRIIGDNYEIYERNGFIYIGGSANLTVEGNSNVLINNAYNVDVKGVTNIRIYNDANIAVGGDCKLRVTENLDIKAKNINIEAEEDFNIKAGENLNIEAAEDLNIKTDNLFMQADSDANLSGNDLYLTAINDANLNGMTVFVEGLMEAHVGSGIQTFVGSLGILDLYATAATNITGVAQINLATATLFAGYAAGFFGMGAASATPPSTATSAERADGADDAEAGDSIDKEEPEMPEFDELKVNTRQDRAAKEYETEDETADEQKFEEFKQTQTDSGAIDPTKQDPNQKANETAKPKENRKQPAGANCDVIFGMQSYPASMKLSQYFTLGDLNKAGSRPIVAQSGLSAQDICCNLKGLSENCLDVIKRQYPSASITSAFRRLQDARNSSPDSQHLKGQAADIVIGGLDRKGHYEAIQWIQQAIPFDQLILEYDSTRTVWIHVSFKYSGNRKQIFTMNHHKRVGNFGEFSYLPER